MRSNPDAAFLELMTMHFASFFQPALSSLRPRALSAGVLSALLLMSACGGGGGESASATDATGVQSGSLSEGPITGFGSIIVNGVRFDESTAQVLDDDEVPRSREALRLGMWVEVEGGAVRGKATGVARSVRFGSQLKGPVSAVNAAAGTLTVLGQPVEVFSGTVFDGLPNGLAGVSQGQVLEVHGITQTATGRIHATRVERVEAADSYKLRGVVTAVDTVKKTFSIGEATIAYGSLDASGLVVGAVVRVKLATVAQNGVWSATALKVQGQKKPGDHDEAHIHGFVTAITSPTQFSLNGLKVDASKASFPDGSAGVVLGARLEVEGRLVEGVLVASKVEVEDRQRQDERHRPELHGVVSAFNATAKTFQLRGLTVTYGASTEFKGMTEAQLRDGFKVEVKGVLAANGTITATRISHED